MKYLFTILSILVFTNFANAQVYINHCSFEGPKNNDPYVRTYDVLPNGNTIVVMNIDTNVVFNPNNVSVYTPTAPKYPGTIVSCVSANNTVLWSMKWFPENYNMNTFVYGVRAIHDAAGNVYLGMRYVGKFDADPGTGTAFLTPKTFNSNDACLIKLDGNGQYQWSKVIGDTTTSTIYMFDMGWLPNGNICVSGEFAGKLDVDPGANVNLFNSGGGSITNGYRLELDANGNYVDAKQLKGNDCTIYKMQTNSLGEHIMLFYFYGSVNLSFNATPINRIAMNSDRYWGIAKYDANYNLMWDKIADSNMRFVDITPAANNNFYLLGNYRSISTLNNGTAVTATGYNDISIDKIDANGNILMSKAFGGKNNNDGLDLKMYGSNLCLLYVNKDSLSFNSGYPSAIYTKNNNLVISVLDTNLQHISSAVFESDSNNITSNSHLVFSGNELLFKMYAAGPTDLDPSISNNVFTPMYGNNNPAVFVKIGMNYPTVLQSTFAKSSLNIYPNPTSNILYFTKQKSDYSVSIVTINGQEVFAGNFSADQSFVNIAKIPAGIYTIILKNKDGVAKSIFEKQ
jgi:Secretion system C-terminal sorting domain